ncbi:MAG: carbohydrate ABC transporter permease [Firmicutes bacterium]|nr:carbohydrate ABC transporter permease [Bacillota bacterium]
MFEYNLSLKKIKKKTSWENIIKFSILSVAAVITIIPLLFMFGKSLEVDGIFNYVNVIKQTSLIRNFANSSIVTIATIVLEVICVTLAAFAFSKLQFPFKSILYMIFLCTLMLPGASVIFPMFLIIKELGLINNFIGLIGPYTAMILPINLIILKNYYDSIPDEFIESASIDGCGR